MNNMIDDKKIEEAATVASISDTEKGRVREGYVISALADHENGFREGYIEGVKWAITEFLKGLWHPVSEKPSIKQGEFYITCLVKFKNGSTELCVYFRTEGWICEDMTSKDFKRNAKEWIYIDDLLTNKEANND